MDAPVARRISGPAPIAVRVEGLTKLFGGAAALKGVDLDVRPGELIALLGPSGSGKTTLLRVIAGLEGADGGAVLFDGKDTTATPVQKRGVGFVFQHYALFKHLSVFDNIAYGLRVRPRRLRPSRADIRRRVMDLLALVQLGGLEGRFPAQLSGGQRQRVALARALAVDPQVLLLDEPFGALDAQVRKDLRRWLREIHDETGQTTIFVTHDQDEALELADRVAILNGGRVEQIGTPDEVHDRPASSFVMSFVGESSRLPVTVSGGIVATRGRTLPVAATLGDGEAVLHLRPHEIAILPGPGSSPGRAGVAPGGSDAPSGREGGLSGTVAFVRRAVGGRRAEVLMEGGDVLEVEVPTGFAVARGDRLDLAIVGGHLFPS